MWLNILITRFSLKSCSHSGTSRNSSLRNSSSSFIYFHVFLLWLLTHNFPFFCCWIFPFNILRCRCWRSRCRWSRGTRPTDQGQRMVCTSLYCTGFFCHFWCDVVSDNWSCRWYTHDLRRASQVKELRVFLQEASLSRIYPILWHIPWLLLLFAPRRWPSSPSSDFSMSSWCPIRQSQVSLADHMHACSEIYHKLSLLQFYGGCGLHNPLFGRRIECSFVLFFELVKSLARFHALPRAHRSCPFSLFLRSVFKFHSVGTSLMRNFDLYFSKRWSFIFSDTCLTLRSLCESYSSNWSQNFLPRVSPETSRFSQVLMAPSHARPQTVVQFSQLATAPLSSLVPFWKLFSAFYLFFLHLVVRKQTLVSCFAPRFSSIELTLRGCQHSQSNVVQVPFQTVSARLSKSSASLTSASDAFFFLDALLPRVIDGSEGETAFGVGFVHDHHSHAGNCTGLPSNTGLFLSTGISYLFLFQRKLSPFNSWPLLLFRFSRVWRGNKFRNRRFWSVLLFIIIWYFG